MLLRHLLLGIFLSWATGIFAQVQQEYQDAQRAFQRHLTIKKSEGRQDLRYTNFQDQLDELKVAFTTVSDIVNQYPSLSDGQKSTLPSYRELDALKEGISQAAADVLRKARYAESYQSIYKNPLYDDLSKRDTLYALRRILVLQTRDFLKTYAGTRAVPTVRDLHRSLLEEFRTLPALRLTGTGKGYRYEENCHEILEAFTADELEHILPEFYGTEFSDIEKLKKLAAEFNKTPLAFLCELRLHFEGVNSDNVQLYERLIKTFAPEQIAWVALQKLIEPDLQEKRWAEAEAKFARFQPLFPERRADFIAVRWLLRRPEDDFKLEALGAHINTPEDETHPVAAYQGLYFCRNAAGSGQDVFWANTKKNVSKLPAPLNTRSHEVPQSISPDGTQLVLFGNYGFLPEYRIEMRAYNDQLGKGDLYFVDRKGTSWTRIRPFAQPISTSSYETGLSYSPDGKAVLFASDRGSENPKSPPDRLFFNGREDFDLDLWVCEQKEDGTWGEAISLGQVLNTPFAESMPILHADGRTLYFTSDGHPGLGGTDIFMARRLNLDSWTAWSEPVNLGKSINSSGDDGFSLDANGAFAYISLKSSDNYDIFKFSMPERFRGDPSPRREWVNGQVQFDPPLQKSATVNIQNLETGQLEARTQTDKSGVFRVRLPEGHRYLVTATATGYFSQSQSLDFRKTPKSAAPTIEAKSISGLLTSESSFVLKNIYFDLNSDQLKPESHTELARLATFLASNKQFKIRIEGHTDSKGEADYNQRLSEARAKSVMEYLEFLGVADERTFYIGFGEAQPLTTNETPEGRAQNRRVAFLLKER